ncbi:hypothetical protein [Frankia sp. R82]|uniref:hypothetical protein n=1 Tax=Frankia sp. R82 TaxID=2950553 RepID=UPI002043101F|nr:hypothetical protein [Frankia sp. R82]MCM3882057.1 hypothetical protein [Frankia sp. R82]
MRSGPAPGFPVSYQERFSGKEWGSGFLAFFGFGFGFGGGGRIFFSGIIDALSRYPAVLPE